jgi:hypothetical protein
MKKVLAALLLVCLVVGGVYYFLGTPRYSLYALGKAIQTKDYETARTLVDEDRLSHDVSTEVTNELFKQMQEQQDRDLAGNPFAGLGTAMMVMMKPRIMEMVQEQMHSGIESALGKDASLATSKSSAGVFDRNRYTGIHLQKIITEGNSAEAIFDHLPSDLPVDLKELHVRMAYAPQLHRWRVVGLPDVSVVLAKVMKDSLANAH